VLLPEAYAEAYQVVIKIHLDGNQWGAVVGKNPIEGVAGFGYTMNEAMVDLTKQWRYTIAIGKSSRMRIEGPEFSDSNREMFMTSC
jgi:hypothetical protein